MIGFYLGPASVGYYSPGYSVGNLINIFFAPLNFILPATLSKHYDNNNIDEVKNILNISLKYYLIVAIPSFFGLSLLSEPLLNILTTPDIASKGYFITPFVALSSLLFGIYTIYQKIIILEKKTKITAKIALIAAISNILLNFLLIPYIGIIGAAFTTLLAYLIFLLLTLYYSSKFLRLYLDIKLLIKCIFSSMVMSYLITTIDGDIEGIISFISVVAIGATIYIITLLILKGITKDDFKTFGYLFKI